MTPPDFSGLASRSVILIRSALGLNKGFPPPKTRGARAKSISSNNPWAKSAAERFALPKTKRSLPGCCFSLATSSSGFSFTSLVLFHSAFLSVLEKTIFGIVFMKSATSPFWDGQYPAIPSYVTRPNNSIPVDFECSIEYFSSSSPQIVSCQSMSQLFGPSKKPSTVTRFHMMSFLMSIHRSRLGSIPGEVNRLPYKYPLSWPSTGSASTRRPLLERAPIDSFGISLLSDRTRVGCRPFDEDRSPLASKPERNPDAECGEHGGCGERVSIPAQAKLRIEGAGDGQHHR